MSSKAYSPEEREAVRVRLLETALAQYSKRGIREVHLSEILEVVGISKPFFYKFFNSVAEFVIEVINSQWDLLSAIVDESNHQSNGCWRKRVGFTLERLIHHREHGILVMTQEEEVWVRKRLSDEHYERFMERQASYFADLLVRWDIPQEKCSPKHLLNMILTIIIIYDSGRNSLPFLYLDELESTAHAQAEGLVLYLDRLRQPN